MDPGQKETRNMATQDRNVRVVVYTPHHRIEGTLVLPKGERLSDKLNVAEREFEALADARVYAIATGDLVHEAPHLAVNKTHISLMLRVE